MHRCFVVFIFAIFIAAPQALCARQAVAAGVATAYGNAVLSDKPVAYYRLNDYGPRASVPNGSNMFDSALHNTGMYRSAAPGGVTGVPELTTKDTLDDAAIRFSPAGLAATIDYWQFHFRYAMTVEAWVRWTGTPSGVIVSFGDAAHAPYDNYKLGYDPVTRKLSYQIAVNGVAHTVEAVTPQPNTVYHIVGTFDTTRQRLYVNGVLRVAEPLHGAIGNYNPHGGYGMTIGNDSTRAHPASAVIDEVALYPTALPSTRVSAHYTTGSPIAPYTIAQLGGANTGSVSVMNNLGDAAGTLTNLQIVVYAGSSVIPLPIHNGIGLFSYPISMNDLGSVLIASDTLYRCSTQAKTCLALKAPMLAGCASPASIFTAFPSALNNLDVVVGIATTPLTCSVAAQQAVEWNAAGDPSPVVSAIKYPSTQAIGINDSGTVIGDGAPGSNYGTFVNGVFARLPAPFGSQPVQSINRHGDILGYDYIGNQAVVRSDLYYLEFPKSPIAGYSYFFAQQINALDQAVGEMLSPAPHSKPVLGLLATAGEKQALRIDSLIPAGSGWTNLATAALNDRGQMTGTGKLNGIANSIFLMSPNAL